MTGRQARRARHLAALAALTGCARAPPDGPGVAAGDGLDPRDGRCRWHSLAMPVSIGELEAVAARGWRAPEEAPLGGWLLRAAEGFTGRANSALAVGDPGMPLAAATAKVSDWYRARGLPAMIATAFPPGRPRESATDRFLEER